LYQVTLVAYIHNAVAFLEEANLAQNQHLVVFQGNVEKWAANHQSKVDSLEKAAKRAPTVTLERFITST